MLFMLVCFWFEDAYLCVDWRLWLATHTDENTVTCGVKNHLIIISLRKGQ